MFNFFKSKVLVTEVAEAFPAWARSLRVCLCTKLTEFNIAKGLTKEISDIIAPQGVNYITGEDWEKNLQSASEEIKSVVQLHKSEVIPLVKAFFETDKTYRELLVNYLRILSVMQVPIRGDEWFGSDDKQRIEKILLVYGPEFPEEADPVKFGQMVHDFHKKVFSKK
jgi:hypothetical protein